MRRRRWTADDYERALIVLGAIGIVIALATIGAGEIAKLLP